MGDTEKTLLDVNVTSTVGPFLQERVYSRGGLSNLTKQDWTDLATTGFGGSTDTLEKAFYGSGGPSDSAKWWDSLGADATKIVKMMEQTWEAATGLSTSDPAFAALHPDMINVLYDVSKQGADTATLLKTMSDVYSDGAWGQRYQTAYDQFKGSLTDQMTDEEAEKFEEVYGGEEGEAKLHKTFTEKYKRYKGDSQNPAILGDTMASLRKEVQRSEDAKEPEESTGPTAEDITQQRRTLQEQLRGELEKSLSKYEQSIPEDVEQLKGILGRQRDEMVSELPRTLGEEFTAGVGLKSGGFQQTMAEEIANQNRQLEDQLAQYQLGRQADIGQQRVNLDQQLAMAQLQFEPQLQVQDYLNKLGYQQQMAAMRVQQQNSLQQMGMQQQFQGTQNMYNRQAQQQQFNQNLGFQQQQANDKKGSFWPTLAQGAVTGLAGAFTGGLGAAAAYGLTNQYFNNQPGQTTKLF